MKRKLRSWLWPLLIWIGSTPSLAQDEKPVLEFNFGARADYEDNVFLTTGSEKSDLLFTLIPEVLGNVLTAPAEFKLKYQPTFILPVQNFDDTRVRRILHIGEFDAKSELANGIKFDLNDQFAALPRTFGVADNQVSGLIQTNRVRLDVTDTIEIGGRSDLETNVRAGRFDTNAGGASRYDLKGGLRVIRQFSGAFALGVGGDVEWQNFDSSAETDFITYRALLEPAYEFSARLKGHFPVGVQWVRFMNGQVGRDIMLDAEVTYQVGEDEDITLGYHQAFQTDSSGDSFRIQQVSIKGSYPLGSRLHLALTTTYGRFRTFFPDPSAGGLRKGIDTLLSIRPGIWYTLSERWKLEGGFSISWNRGDISENDYDSRLAFVGATYSLWGL